MNLTRLLVLLLCVTGLVGVATEARADLILNVTDLGGGQTRWVFSGSATATGSNNSYNSLWGMDWNGGAGDPVNNDGTTIYAIVSGSGTVFSTTNGVSSVIDIGVQDLGPGDQLIAPRTSGTVYWNPGDLLSWDGDITVNLPYANLNPGVYRTSILQPGSGIREELVLTIGAAVPEPGSIALLGLGLAGLGIASRRRKAKAS